MQKFLLVINIVCCFAGSSQADCAWNWTVPTQADLLTDLQGYWQFNNNGSDSSSNQRDLDLVGGPGFSPGLLGEALRLTGNATQYANRPMDDLIFDLSNNDFTIQIWVKFNSTSGEQTLFEKFDGPGGPGYTLTKLHDNRIQFFARGITTMNSSVLTINTGRWHQVVMRRNGSNFDIYFNNISVAQSTQLSTIVRSSNPLRIGEREGSQQFPINGLIDEVAFWSRALSDNEINQIYNNGNGYDLETGPPPPPPPIHANSFLVTRGTYVSGGVVELATSDNTDLSIRRATSDTQSVTEFEVEAVSPVPNPSSLEVTLEGSVFARSNVNQTIELYDYVARVWEQIDTRPATRFTDSTVTVAATGDLSRFIEVGIGSMSHIRARVRYQSTNPRQRFASNTDQFVWIIGL